MIALISMLGLLAFFGIGAFTVYMLIDFLEYIKRFHSATWQELSYERPFGRSQEDFYFYPVRPMRLIPFIFSPENIGDSHLALYKNKIKLALGAWMLTLLVFIAAAFIG